MHIMVAIEVILTGTPQHVQLLRTQARLQTPDPDSLLLHVG